MEDQVEHENGGKKRQYVNDNQQNLLRVVEYLAQDILIPKTLKELSDALNISRDVTFRTLWNLADKGWAEECANGWRLSPAITKISDRLRLALADTFRRYLPAEAQNTKTTGGMIDG